MSVLKIHLTYQCSAACDHCRFRCTPSPGEAVDYDLATGCIRTLKRINGLDYVVLLGGEPGLFPQLTWRLASASRQLGIGVRVETNGSWAVSEKAAREFLAPLYRDQVHVCFSLDALHERFIPPASVQQAIRVSDEMGGSYSFEVAYLNRKDRSHLLDVRTDEMVRQVEAGVGHPLKTYRGGILFNGRATERLAGAVSTGRGVPHEVCDAVPWWPKGFLRTLDLIILDPQGNLSKGCGIYFGNVRRESLEAIVASYDAGKHPIFSVLLTEGPLGLARQAEQLGYRIKQDYADRCHPCQEARDVLRGKYPAYLGPFGRGD